MTYIIIYLYQTSSSSYSPSVSVNVADSLLKNLRINLVVKNTFTTATSSREYSGGIIDLTCFFIGEADTETV